MTERATRLRSQAVAGLSGFARTWLVFIGAVVVWEVATRLAESVFFPPPTEIVSTALQLWFSGPASQLFLSDVVFDHILPSLGRCLAGWAIAVILGVGLGTALGRSRTGMDYVGPLFAFFRAIPPPTLVPVFMVLFGLGPGMQVATIIFGAIWPVLLNTVDGVRAVDSVKVDTARSFRTPTPYWIGMVVLPAALPKIFAGLRLSLSISLILMVVSELIGSLNGIGHELISAQRAFEFPLMWTWIVLLGILGFGLNSLLLAAERRVLRWQPNRNNDG
ncbi:ABC transporter permease [Prauserella sp. ASG 168]|uniref:ABC transporter permease n=1 Tax=Prauserella cavernicola TaxID=2800127 RepID=A0A934QSE6_9PSEU|nr:ABC transporter permease [Prauserella cavernicola]MBK1785358.1 ABC transporter permease [Prauserella cavernicola]